MFLPASPPDFSDRIGGRRGRAGGVFGSDTHTGRLVPGERGGARGCACRLRRKVSSDDSAPEVYRVAAESLDEAAVGGEGNCVSRKQLK
jgi:hypothetical protein